MYYIGIDISKFKHDCAVIDDSGEIVTPSWSFTNDSEGFSQLKILLVDSSRNREEALVFQFFIQFLDNFVGVRFGNAQFLRYFLYSHKACVFHFITPSFAYNFLVYCRRTF